MRIGFVRVFVSDFKIAFDFYTKQVGMELDFTDNSNWAQFKSGEDVSLAIELCDPARTELGSKLVGRLVGVTLLVDDIDATYKRLSANGVEFGGKPEKQEWGGTLVNMRDPDGNILTIMESKED